MPRISSSETATMIRIAGRLTRPVTVAPSASVTLSNGETTSRAGRLSPQSCSSDTTYRDQLTDTVAAPTAYSSTRSQPMIHATISPMVA
jgi:hypothetical protein